MGRGGAEEGNSLLAALLQCARALLWLVLGLGGLFLGLQAVRFALVAPCIMVLRAVEIFSESTQPDKNEIGFGTLTSHRARVCVDVVVSR